MADNWFQTHTFIVSYLNAFQYAVSTEGDYRLQQQYRHYTTSESCKLAQISRLSGEKRLSKLNRQAAAVQKDFGRFRRLSDERRRDREAKDRDRMRFLSPVARVSYGDPYHREERRTKRWR